MANRLFPASRLLQRDTQVVFGSEIVPGHRERVAEQRDAGSPDTKLAISENRKCERYDRRGSEDETDSEKWIVGRCGKRPCLTFRRGPIFKSTKLAHAEDNHDKNANRWKITVTIRHGLNADLHKSDHRDHSP